MSFMDEYNALKKKRKQDPDDVIQAVATGVAAAGTTKKSQGSFMDEYNKLKEERKETEVKKRPIQERMTVRFTAGDYAPTKEQQLEQQMRAYEEKAARIFGGAPVKEEKENKWFQKGASEESVSKAILGTIADFGEDLTAGLVGMGEKTVDALAYLGTALARGQYSPSFSTQANQAAIAAFDTMDAGTEEFIKKDLYDEHEVAKELLSNAYGAMINLPQTMNGGYVTPTDFASQRAQAHYALEYADNQMELDSVLAEKSDELVQSGGELLGTAALSAMGIPSEIVIGLTSFGGEAENALKQGASFEEAGFSATVSAGAEILTEKISGGISFGGKTLDDAATQWLASNISNKAVRTMANMGMQVAGEGAEEVLSGYMSAIGQKLSYMDEKELKEIFTKEDAWDSFIGGSILGGIGSTTQTVKSEIHGVDSVTGMTKNEQKVVDKVYKDELAKLEEKGKVTAKQKSELYQEVTERLEKGYFSTDTIEEVLGGESYQNYRNTVDNEDAILKEFEELGKKQNATLAEQARYSELSQQAKDIWKNTKRDQMKAQLSKDVYEMSKGDRLVESYFENVRAHQKYEADLTQYQGKGRDVIQKVMESGLADNSNQTHEFWDMAAKIANDRNQDISIATQEEILEMVKKEYEAAGKEFDASKFDGKIIDGYFGESGIVLNAQTKRALNFVLGHEIMHTLEQSNHYADVQKILFEYNKGEYDTRFKERAGQYENIYDNEDFKNKIDKEVAADMVGDFLFTDKNFVKHLSTANRNVFQKMWDEVKYLYNMATAGSKEARELEKVKKAFEDAYRANGKQSETKYSLSAETDKTYADAVNRGDMETAQKMVDEAAKKAGFSTEHLYHGTSFFGFTTIDTSESDDSISFFATNNQEVAQGYMPWYEDDASDRHHEEPRRIGDDIKKRAITNSSSVENVLKTLNQAFSNQYQNARRATDKETLDSFKVYHIPEMVDAAEELIKRNVPEKIKNLCRLVVDANRKDTFSAWADVSKRYKEFESAEIPYDPYDWSKDILWSRVVVDLQSISKMARTDPIWNNGAVIMKSALIDRYNTYLGGESIGMYDFYGNNENQMVVWGSGSNWKSIPLGEHDAAFKKWLAEEKGSTVQSGREARASTRDISEFAKHMGYRSVVFVDIYDAGAYGERGVLSDVYSFFYPQEDIKSADPVTYDDSGNVIPLSERFKHTNPDIRYSLSDSDGKQLSKEQQEYFKDSKMRDENGNLKVMYHGSQDAGFHVFDARMSDDDTSFFFVDRNDVAASYSGTSETYEAKTIRTAEDMNNFLAEIGYDDYEAVEKSGKFELLENGEHVAWSDTAQGIYEEFCWYEGVGEGDVNYKVYLNLTNPLEVDAQGSHWNELPGGNTRNYAAKAKAEGYDGVIFKNIVDNGGYSNGSEGASTVAIAFDSNQIKSVANEKPTGDPDIRFSVSEAENQKGLDSRREVEYSISYDTDYSDAAIRLNETQKNVDTAVMKAAKDLRGYVAKRLTEMVKNGVALPPDELGDTWHEDKSYGGTMENTLVCPRSLAPEAFMDAVSKTVGRPLTVKEQIHVSQELMTLMTTSEELRGQAFLAQCVYCYVAADRMAQREFLGEYIKQRDAVLQKVANNSNIDVSQLEADHNALAKWWENKKGKKPELSEIGKLYQEFLAKRKPTGATYERFKMWVENYTNGSPMIDGNHLASIEEIAGDLSNFDAALVPQIRDAWKYAQSASWAKKRTSYVAYNGQILKWDSDVITALNEHYGMRMYSFSDYHPAFVLENMQMITDAAVRGLKTLAYTKDLDFAEIFAPTHANINISTFGFEKNGTVYEDNQMGAEWAKAKALRDQYPNVGITFVATNDTITEWAMQQDWIDVVIPYHMVKTGKIIADHFGYKNYTRESGDKKKPVWRKDKAWKEDHVSSIAPTMHDNNLETYLSALEANGLTPRFKRFLDNPATRPYYMKLVNECRLPASQSLAVEPKFNEDAIERTLARLATEGYYTPIGGSVDRMMEIAAQVAEGMPEMSISDIGQTHKEYGSWNVYSKYADIAPVIQKDAPAAVSKTETTTEDIAPLYDATGKKGVPDGQQAFMPDAGTTEPLTRKGLHQRIVESVKTRFKDMGFDFDNVLKTAKNLSTFATVDNTPQRVMEKALGYKEGGVLADLTVNKVAQNETEGIKWLNSFTDRKSGLLAQISRQYHIKPGSKESAAAQMYAEGFYVGENNDIIAYGDAELAKDFPDANVQRNIKGLASDPRIRRIYDETLKAINESRTRNAYPEIPRLDNYFLHFRAMDDTFSRLGLPFNPNDIRAKDLPTDLNGVTADLKPGQPYFASAMHRTGKRTSFDLLGGLERYLTSAKNQIYHIDDIQTLRALRNYIADTYGQANGLEGLDALSEEEAQDRIEKVYNSHLSTFAKFLNEEANILAGKTALIDRGLEGIIGRRGITFLNTVNGQVGSNMVGFNISSSLTNFLPVAQTFAKTNKVDFVKAFGQTVAHKVGSIFGRGDSFTENSPVVIRRKGSDRFYRTTWQKMSDPGYALMSVVDDISTELIARTKYNELTRKGMDSQQAHYETDKWVSKLMGDRSLGQQPQLYNSKMLGLVTKFQLEVRNQLDSQFYDTIQEAKASNEHIQNGLEKNARTAAKVASTFVQLAAVQHLFGMAFESVAGYNPAFDIVEVMIKAFGWDDDEESEDTALDNIEQGFLALLEDLPYTGTFTGGRIPIESALPIEQFIMGKDQYGNDKSRWETLAEVAPYYLMPGGYGQAKKTVQGLKMFSDDHPIAGSYTGNGALRFPVEDTLGNRIQAGIFGQWANENAQDYIDNGRKPLEEKQIQEFMDVDIPIRDYWEYREGLSGLSKLGEKADYIDSLDLPIDKKNLLMNNIADREDPIDMTGYENYDSFDEFDFAVKNPDKYEIAQAVGGYEKYMEYQEGMKDMKLAEKVDYVAGLNLTTKQKNALINGETDRKEPIDLTGYENYGSFEEFEFAKKNPENYAVAKAVGGYEDYKKYSDALNDIKSDKDEYGQSISGSRKEKVQAYINSLDANYYTKLILYKSEYTSYDDENMVIINYLNQRNDISYKEMEAILLKLGFKVDSQGNIFWD